MPEGTDMADSAAPTMPHGKTDVVIHLRAPFSCLAASGCSVENDTFTGTHEAHHICNSIERKAWITPSLPHQGWRSVSLAPVRYGQG